MDVNLGAYTELHTVATPWGLMQRRVNREFAVILWQKIVKIRSTFDEVLGIYGACSTFLAHMVNGWKSLFYQNEYIR